MILYSYSLCFGDVPRCLTVRSAWNFVNLLPIRVSWVNCRRPFCAKRWFWVCGVLYRCLLHIFGLRVCQNSQWCWNVLPETPARSSGSAPLSYFHWCLMTSHILWWLQNVVSTLFCYRCSPSLFPSPLFHLVHTFVIEFFWESLGDAVLIFTEKSAQIS